LAGDKTKFSLLFRAGTVLCAFPAECVIETMRPPPLKVLSGTPHFVTGMAIVRGAPLPVIAVTRLFGHEEKRPARLVIARVATRRVGFAVDQVVGIRALAAEMLERLPPLLRDASHDAIADIGTLDGELMVVLQAARVVPAEIFAIVEKEVIAS
jgi:purine-binding chemotaxis protein CheW